MRFHWTDIASSNEIRKLASNCDQFSCVDHAMFSGEVLGAYESIALLRIETRSKH